MRGNGGTLYYDRHFEFRLGPLDSGEEHFGMFHISMGENETWNLDYPFDDYEACLRDCIEKIGRQPNID